MSLYLRWMYEADPSAVQLVERVRTLETFKAKAIELYPSLTEDWKRIERSSLEHAQTVDAGTEEDGA